MGWQRSPLVDQKSLAVGDSECHPVLPVMQANDCGICGMSALAICQGLCNYEWFSLSLRRPRSPSTTSKAVHTTCAFVTKYLQADYDRNGRECWREETGRVSDSVFPIAVLEGRVERRPEDLIVEWQETGRNLLQAHSFRIFVVSIGRTVG